MVDKKYTQYAEDVINGKIVACTYVKLACQRYLSWFDREDIVFIPEKADKVVNFCHHLKHFTEDLMENLLYCSHFNFGWSATFLVFIIKIQLRE